MLLAVSLRKLIVPQAAACLLLVALVCALPASARADVWRFVDANGVSHFTNEPPNKNFELVIRSDPSAPEALSANQRHGTPEADAHRTVAVMHASPAYQAVQGKLTTASTSYGVDCELLKAVVATESAFNPRAVSHKGAVGLMQIMPATARRYGIESGPGLSVASKLTDPELNIRTGTRHLADLLRLYGGQTELALAAYNAGEGAVSRAGNRIPNFKETQHYVKRVMAVYRVLQTRMS